MKLWRVKSFHGCDLLLNQFSYQHASFIIATNMNPYGIQVRKKFWLLSRVPMNSSPITSEYPSQYFWVFSKLVHCLTYSSNYFWVPFPVLFEYFPMYSVSHTLFQLLQNDSQVIQLSCILSYLLLSNLLSTSEYSSQILGEITFCLAYSPNCFWVTYPRLSEYSQVM